MVPPMLLLTLVLACSAGLDDTGAASSLWDQLAPVPLDPLRPLLRATLPDAGTPTRLSLLSEQPHAFVLDRDAGLVHVFDSRYRHDHETACIATKSWPDLPVSEVQQGSCDDGQVELARGTLDPLGTPLGLAAEGTRVVLWAEGRLYQASADLLGGSPWDLLRLDEGVALDVPSPVFSSDLAAGEGVVYVASDGWLGTVDDDGVTLESWALPGPVRDVVLSDGLPWVATDAGVWSPELGLVNGADVNRLAPDGAGGVWAVDLADERAVHLGPTGSATAWEAPGATGPVAVDVHTGRVALAIEGGFALLADGVELARVQDRLVKDLAFHDHHELVVLDGEGLTVFGDEEVLVGAPPLALIAAAFVEQPRSADSDYPCLDGDETIASHLAVAAQNRRLLDDLPTGVALGVTPHMARRALRCGQIHDLHRVVSGPRIELGVLNHELPDDTCVQTPACHQNFLSEQHADVANIGLTPRWTSGLVVHEDGGADWVENLVATGVSDTYLQFGLSVLAEIDHGGDPRAKQPFPLGVSGGTETLVASTLDDLFDPESGGALRLLAGNSLAAFRLSVCPNLLLWECNLVPGAQDQPTFDPQDIEVLQLLLFRALAGRSDSESAWSFHLPDIGEWDYTRDCAVQDDLWTGEQCQAAMLQQWLLDVHARYVDAGLVTWDLPGEVPWPD